MTEVTQEKNRRVRKQKEAAPAAPAPAPAEPLGRTNGKTSHRHQLPNGLVVIYH